VSGIEKGRRYNLDQEVVRIGAVAQDGSEKNDIIVRDVEHMISRFHCEIHNNNGKFYLLDCNSANGTQVDKKLVPPGEPQRLRRGARVDLAGTVTLDFGMERRRKNKASA
jgi:predicted component of type VI protein secretion system